MAKLTKSDILHIDKLAKLELTVGEIEKFSGQLSDVIEFVSQLQEVKVEGVEPTSQTTGLTDVFREDRVDPSNILSQDEALSGIDKTHNGYFKVKAILVERSDK